MKEELCSELNSEIWSKLNPKINLELWNELWLKFSSENVPEISSKLEGEIDEMIDNGRNKIGDS